MGSFAINCYSELHSTIQITLYLWLGLVSVVTDRVTSGNSTTLVRHVCSTTVNPKTKEGKGIGVFCRRV